MATSQLSLLHLNTGTCWSPSAKLCIAVPKLPMEYAAYRRQRLAQKLMNDLEDITEKVHKAYFVDLFVRVSNASAIQMYNKVSHCAFVQLLMLQNRFLTTDAAIAFSLATAYTEQCWGTIVVMKMHMTCARPCQGIKRANLSSRSLGPSIHTSWNMIRQQFAAAAHHLWLRSSTSDECTK